MSSQANHLKNIAQAVSWAHARVRWQACVTCQERGATMARSAQAAGVPNTVTIQRGVRATKESVPRPTLNQADRQMIPEQRCMHFTSTSRTYHRLLLHATLGTNCSLPTLADIEQRPIFWDATGINTLACNTTGHCVLFASLPRVSAAVVGLASFSFGVLWCAALLSYNFMSARSLGLGRPC